MDLQNFLEAMVAGLGGGAVVLGAAAAFLHWLGGLWAERILQAERARDSSDLEREKAEHNRDLERLKNGLQSRLDRAKWPMSREDQLAAEFRDAVQQLAIAMASALHSICWLTWISTVALEELTNKRMRRYDNEMHVLLPQISGALLRLATIDSASYGRLEKHVRSIYRLDAKVGEACHAIKRSRNDPDVAADEAIRSLQRRHRHSRTFEREIPRRILDLVNDQIEQRALRTLGDGIGTAE